MSVELDNVVLVRVCLGMGSQVKIVRITVSTNYVGDLEKDVKIALLCLVD